MYVDIFYDEILKISAAKGIWAPKAQAARAAETKSPKVVEGFAAGTKKAPLPAEVIPKASATPYASNQQAFADRYRGPQASKGEAPAPAPKAATPAPPPVASTAAPPATTSTPPKDPAPTVPAPKPAAESAPASTPAPTATPEAPANAPYWNWKRRLGWGGVGVGAAGMYAGYKGIQGFQRGSAEGEEERRRRGLP